MTENLAEMLTSYKRSLDDEEEKVPITTSEEEGDKGEMMEDPTDVKIPVETVAEVVAEEAPIENCVNIIPFTDWIEKNNASLGTTSGITKVKIAVADVDASTSIGFKAPNLKGEKDAEGNIKKDLFFVKDINNFNVLDLPMFHLKIYKGDLFRIIHQYSDTIFIKEYSIKTGSVLVFCTPIDNHLIPYAKMKLKKGDKAISAIEPNLEVINEKMNGTGDIEALQLLYKQSIKVKDKLTNMKEIADWILKRYEDAIDVNHQMQIDGVIINQVQ